MKAFLAFLRLQPVRVVATLIVTGLLAALLAATIYWTRFDVMWIAFLGGVLFAAGIALATQLSKAQWLALRRSKQLDRVRSQLIQEAARSRNAAEAMRIAEARLHLLSNALPTLVLYVDRDERCRYHNLTVEQKTGRSAEQITGRPLSEVISGIYPSVAPHIAETLAGKTVDYECSWSGPALPETYTARHVPYPPDESPPRGFYLLLTSAGVRPGARLQEHPQLIEPTAEEGKEGLAIPSDSGETIYLRSITDELMGWDDPRAKLEYALSGNQFLLFAQKIIALKGDLPDPLCYEILLRLREEEENLLPPGGFIPVAERYGMMEDIDRWVVRNIIAWCIERKSGDPAWRAPLFCINLSKATVCGPAFARYVQYEVRERDFDARSLCFEIEEEEIINQHAHVQRFINSLRPLGCRFTADAFGSVKVSFAHLKGLAIDFIKIDGIIIQNILRDPAELAKAKAINTVCRKVGIRTIAEFVESQETLDKLNEIGVDYVQGFGVARPEPIGKIA